MAFDPELAVSVEATAVGMSAMARILEPLDVEQLVTRTSERLTREHPLFRAVIDFATDYELVRHDPEQLAERGEKLRDQVLRLSRPDPVDAGRRDIYD